MGCTVAPGSDNSIAPADAGWSDAAVDLPAVLAAFDEQMRRRPVAGPGVRVEAEDRLTRTVGTDGSWSAVVWSDLTESDANGAIAAEVARAGGSLEWKHYSHDRPADLPDRLNAAGFQSEPVETVLVADIAELDLPVAAPAGVRVTVWTTRTAWRRCCGCTTWSSAPGPRTRRWPTRADGPDTAAPADRRSGGLGGRRTRLGGTG
jgi:hypothetical protein